MAVQGSMFQKLLLFSLNLLFEKTLGLSCHLCLYIKVCLCFVIRLTWIL